MGDATWWNVDRPETRELAARMRKVADEFGDEGAIVGYRPAMAG